MEHECSIYSSIWWKAVWAEGRENGAGGQESLGRNPVWYLSRPSESLSGAQGLHRSIRKVGQQSYSLGLLHPFTGDQGAVSFYLVITEATPFFISSPDLYSCIAGWWDQALHQIIALFSLSLSGTLQFTHTTIQTQEFPSLFFPVTCPSGNKVNYLAFYQPDLHALFSLCPPEFRSSLPLIWTTTLLPGWPPGLHLQPIHFILPSVPIQTFIAYICPVLKILQQFPSLIGSGS